MWLDVHRQQFVDNLAAAPRRLDRDSRFGSCPAKAFDVSIGIEINSAPFLDGIPQSNRSPRRREINLVLASPYDSSSKHLTCHLADHLLDQLD